VCFVPARSGSLVLDLEPPVACDDARREQDINWDEPMNSIASTDLVLGSRYVLERLIAVGGMGQVWKATDRVLERPVAIKLIRTDLLDSEDFRRRFQAEARLAAALSHPGIAHVYDFAEESIDGQRVAFLVMEFIDGEPLSHRLAQGDRPDLGDIVSILHQTAQALSAAHTVGIVHRDIKPGNLLITRGGGVKVTDFGIARAIDSADITEVGTVIGTVRYMSPEQARGEEVTPASDVYSLAVIGYEMLAGRTPFDGDSPVAIALAHVEAAPPALPIGVPPGLRSLIEQSLAKRPEGRPVDGAQFADALQQVTIDPISPPIGPPDPRAPQPNRHADVDSTAVYQFPETTIDRLAPEEHGATEIVPAASSVSDQPLITDGWIRQQRRRRRVAGWGAALAVSACLLGLLAWSAGADSDRSDTVSGASDATVTTSAPPSPAADLVGVDPAAYLGRTEADARALLTAAGLTAAVETAPSTVDRAGIVIDVQPNGPVAPGSIVTITLGDGTIVAATDPVTDNPGTGGGGGRGPDKDNGKGKKRD
jgi:serine/threonine protein kinase